MLGRLLRTLFRSGHRAINETATNDPAIVKPILTPKRKSQKFKPSKSLTTEVLKGECHVIDGDTIVIRGTKIRIAGIDAPELDHPWGKKSKFAMIGLCKGKIITAVIQEEVSYDRIVAKCFLPDGTDVAAELVKQGLALDWPKFSGGEYTNLEPPGIRKKLWRAAARQRGKSKS